jgi:hypothetical protein
MNTAERKVPAIDIAGFTHGDVVQPNLAVIKIALHSAHPDAVISYLAPMLRHRQLAKVSANQTQRAPTRGRRRAASMGIEFVSAEVEFLIGFSVVYIAPLT